MIYYTFDEGLTFQIQSFTPSTIRPRSLKFNPVQLLWAIGHDNTTNKVGTFLAVILHMLSVCMYVCMCMCGHIRSQFWLSNMSTSLLLALCHRKPGTDVDLDF